MIICEVLMLSIIVIACVVSSYTDIKENKIYNKVLCGAAVSTVLIEVIYCAVFTLENLIPFLVNVLTIGCISILLYKIHVWAAGDSKLLIIIAIGIPSRWHIVINNKPYTIVLIVVFSFILGYLYLLFDSVATGIRKKQIISRKFFFVSVKKFIANYFAILNYLMVFNLLDGIFISKIFNLVFVVYIIVGLCISAFLSYFSKLKALPIVIGLLAINIAARLVFMGGFNKINYGSYLFVMMFEIMRIFVSQYNYDEIYTRDIKPGMILSTSSSVIINMTQLKNIPCISKEDQSNRLTVSEAEAVVTWGKSKFGTEKIVIVRKIPFAIFISMGALLYILIGGYFLCF